MTPAISEWVSNCLQAAQVHATLAMVAASVGENNRVTKHTEKSRAYLALVEE